MCVCVGVSVCLRDLYGKSLRHGFLSFQSFSHHLLHILTHTHRCTLCYLPALIHIKDIGSLTSRQKPTGTTAIKVALSTRLMVLRGVPLRSTTGVIVGGLCGRRDRGDVEGTQASPCSPLQFFCAVESDDATAPLSARLPEHCR